MNFSTTSSNTVVSHLAQILIFSFNTILFRSLKLEDASFQQIFFWSAIFVKGPYFTRPLVLYISVVASVVSATSCNKIVSHLGKIVNLSFNTVPFPGWERGGIFFRGRLRRGVRGRAGQRRVVRKRLVRPGTRGRRGRRRPLGGRRRLEASQQRQAEQAQAPVHLDNIV